MEGRAGAKADGTKASAGGPQVSLSRRNTAGESFREIPSLASHTLFEAHSVFHLQMKKVAEFGICQGKSSLLAFLFLHIIQSLLGGPSLLSLSRMPNSMK